ncbi:MAG: hypothetical protein ABH808_02965 [Candidatus Kuenenbacteria bacterium]
MIEKENKIPEIEMERMKDLEWEMQNKMINEILDKGICEYILENNIDLKEGKENEQIERKLGCIDGRINREVEITLAGSGVLLKDKEELEKFIIKNKITIITTHDDCGAAKMKFCSDLIITQRQADGAAKEYIKGIVKELNEKNNKIRHEHIDRVEPNYHNERVIYFNNVDKFNPTKIKELPSGFVIEKFINIENNAKKELSIAICIALGEHGFGKRFTKNEPLIIACCLNKNDSFENIKLEVEKILGEMEIENKFENIKERIKIDYFVVPDKKVE